MEPGSSWKSRFSNEIDQARAARRSGNEGKARVCARRAAGIVVQEALRRYGTSLTDPSAYVQLKYFHDLPRISPDIQGVISHFLMRITEEGNLPIEADLIQDALWLATELLPNSSID